VVEEDLKHAFGYQQRGSLEKCLAEQGIKYFHGQGGRLVVAASEFNRHKMPEKEEIKLA